jgi:hypothetical protein
MFRAKETLPSLAANPEDTDVETAAVVVNSATPSDRQHRSPVPD